MTRMGCLASGGDADGPRVNSCIWPGAGRPSPVGLELTGRTRRETRIFQDTYKAATCRREPAYARAGSRSC